MPTVSKLPSDLSQDDGRTSGGGPPRWAGIAGLVHDTDAAPDGRVGRVTLVGAGPGAADLLTIRALRALQAADVLLVDALVEDEVVALAGPEVSIVRVGKRGGQASCRQEDINDLMVALARSGKNVVRLKSGDPTIFGRAGEEMARLAGEGIPLDIVPGISAASGLAASLGLSLTHRDHAQSVRFITGHSKKGGLPDDVNWAQVADEKTTTVFYMGGRLAGDIARRLIAEGLSASTPAVAVASISRPDETLWHGDLEALAGSGHGLPTGAPILLAVGGALAAWTAGASEVRREARRAA